jgi:ABC-type uncharacterized transport system permease subunit
MQIFLLVFSKKRIDSFHSILKRLCNSLHIFALPPVKIPDGSIMAFQASGSRWKKLSEVSGAFRFTTHMGHSRVLTVLTNAQPSINIFPLLFSVECRLSINIVRLLIEPHSSPGNPEIDI